MRLFINSIYLGIFLLTLVVCTVMLNKVDQSICDRVNAVCR